MPYADPECERASKREKYLADPGAYLERNRTRRRELRDWIAEIKGTGPCVDCGGKFPSYVFDYDHRDPRQKTGNIAYLVMRGYSRVRILAEIEKCDLVCANCHRIRTHLQGPVERETPLPRVRGDQ